MSYLTQAIEAAGKAGLGGEFEVYHAWQARADVLNDYLTKLRADARRKQAEVVQRLADGDATAEQVRAAADEADSWGYDGSAAKFYVHAVRTSHESAERSAVATAKTLFPRAVAAAKQAVEQSLKLTTKLGGARSAAEVVAAGGSAAGAWRELGAWYGRWTALIELANVLANGEYIPKIRPIMHDQNNSWLCFEHPEKLPKGYGALPVEVRLSTAWNAGAGPGLFDAASATRRRAKIYPGYMTFEAPGGQFVHRMDALGNLLDGQMQDYQHYDLQGNHLGTSQVFKPKDPDGFKTVGAQ